MPIVASMGGVAGSQTLTLVIRGIAQGAIQGSNSGWLIRREIALGVINGMGWALIVSGVTFAFFDDITLAIIIAFAMVLNITIAALSGSLLPKILTALRIDPAVAGMVVLTTITDVVGFLTFLGLATYFYA
jgi:magnesium transporter